MVSSYSNETSTQRVQTSGMLAVGGCGVLGRVKKYLKDWAKIQEPGELK